MNILNSKERRQQFIRFLGSFLLLLLIVISVVLMGMQVPFKENEQLKDKMLRQEEVLVFQKEFTLLNEEVVQLLDTLQFVVANSELVEGRITSKIQQMDGLIQLYQGADKSKYLAIVKGLSHHKDDKKTIRMGGSKEQELAEYEKRIAQLEQNRDEWKAQAEKLQMQIQLMNR